MKKFLIVFSLLYFQHGYGQVKDFAGLYAELYINHVLTVKPIDIALQEYGYQGFYTRAKVGFNVKDVFNPIHKIGLGSFANGSMYKSLVYRRFSCEGVFKDSVNSTYLHEYYWLRLKNDTLGITYYHYDTKYAHSFPFEVDSILQIPQEKLCGEIGHYKDKFEGHDKYTTPLEYDISFMKVKYDTTYRYYLSVSYPISSPTFAKGVIVLLNDGSKLNYPEAKVETDTRGKDAQYYIKSFIQLSDEDLLKLKEKEITDVKIYATEIRITDGWRYRRYLKCLFDRK